MSKPLRALAILLAGCLPPTARAGVDEPDLVGSLVDESGRPVAGATVLADIRGKRVEVAVDANGSFRVPLPAEVAGGLLWGSLQARTADGRLGVLSVRQAADRREPVKVVVKPARGLAVSVVDRDGKPVAGASIDFLINMHSIVEGRTDAEGRWAARVPADATGWAVLARKGGVGFDYATAERARGSTERPLPLPGDLKLTLDGAKPLRVKVVDRDGKPIPGVNVGPWLIHKPGREADINLSGMLMRWPVTGGDGVSTLDWLPEAPDQMRSILTRADRFHALDHATWIPAGKPVDELTITLYPKERLAGRVTDAEGRPAPGVVVSIEGQGAYDNAFRGSARTDAEGRYEAEVYSEQAYILAATRGDLAAPYRADVVVRAGRPAVGVDLVLGRATKVRGRVTIGKDDRPAPGVQVTLLVDKGQIPPELRREGDRPSRTVTLRTWAQSDESGRYEFHVGPGEYQIQGPARVEPAKVVIPATDPPAEVVVNLRMPRPETGPLAGTVVDKEGHPVPGALVDGMYGSFQARRWFYRIKADEKGSFRTERSLDPLVLHATTPGGKLGGIVRSDPEATEARIVLGPLATANGRLLETGGKPVAGRKLAYGIRVYMGESKNSPWTDTFGGKAETDDRGRFTLADLVPGEEYHLILPLGEDGSSMGVTEVTANGPGPFDLGDVEVDTRPIRPYVPPTVQQRTAEAFEARKSSPPRERLEATLAEARREYTRPLLLFGKADDPECIELFRLFNEPTPEAEEGEGPPRPRPKTPAGLRWEFELASLDSSRPEVRRLAADLGADAEEGRPPVLVVLDGEGSVSARYPLRLDDARKLDGPALASFLAGYKPATRDAETMLAEALARARAEDKRVFLIASASWCGPCRMLSRFLAPRKAELERHYVFVKLDISRDLHALSVRDRFKGAAEGGVPWYAILDLDGKPMVTSNLPGKTSRGDSTNIGFPSTRVGVDHFVEMLRRTAPRLTPETLDEVKKALLKK